jgi:hypothetical protein
MRRVICPIFTDLIRQLQVASTSILVITFAEIPRWMRRLLKTRGGICTKSGHGLVDGVHSIEKSIVRSAHFSLTEKIERVQQDRSLTASKFYRLVQRPGLKRNHFLGAS